MGGISAPEPPKTRVFLHRRRASNVPKVAKDKKSRIERLAENRVHPSHAEYQVVSRHERGRAKRSLTGVRAHPVNEPPDLGRREARGGSASVE